MISIYFLPSNKNIYTSKILPEIENTMAAMSAESEGATTDDDVHLSPSSVCSSASGGGRGGGGGARGGGGAVSGGVRFKILCSFGGRIMPRPSDGALKYIGGETRVLAVHRSIPFANLKKKVEEMFRTEVAAIKYQLLSEDLDVLVSVTCDEDLVHMLDEYDRFEAKRSPSASPRFRVYVFASSPPPQHAFVSPAAAASISSSSSSRHASYARSQQQYHQLQQQQHRHGHHFQPDRYVATVPSTPNGSPPYPDQPNGVVSAGNSPRAPNIVAEQQPVFRAGGMQRVRSSPNLGGLNGTLQQFNQHAGEDGGLSGYMSSSPVHAAASPLISQGSNYSSHYRHPQQHQYAPAPVPVPVPLHGGGAGRYDAPRGYARGGSSYMAAPMVPALRSGRPVTRVGAPTYGEMQTPKKTATIWD